jgi:hypothetical protein|tara:strand:+ start:388 stop:546 length:159 start_codon:yes stop_codon:yes gene_type:complete
MRDIDNLKTDGMVIAENIYSKAELINLAKSVDKIRRHPNGQRLEGDRTYATR